MCLIFDTPPTTFASNLANDAHQFMISFSHRKLPNIFLIYRGEPSEYESAAPTFAPTVNPDERETNYRSCGASEGGAVSTASVDIEYDVEYTMADPDGTFSEIAQELLIHTLSLEMIDSLHASSCGHRLESSSSSRRLAIESISSGPNDAAQGECVSAENQSCSRFVGSLLVGFSSSSSSSSEEGDDDDDNDDMWEVGNTVLQSVAADMSSDAYLAALNLALEEASEGVSVTSLQYVGTDFYDTEDQPSFSGLRGDSYVVVEGGGLTTLGKALMPILAVMFLAMLALCFLGYRSRGDDHFDREEKRESATLVSEEEDGIFVDRETTLVSGVVSEVDGMFVDSEYGDDKSYMSADMHDLGKSHTKMDVGRCSKASCSACSSSRPLQLIAEVDAPSEELDDEAASMGEDECAGEECTYVQQPLEVSKSPNRMFGMLGLFGSPPTMVEAMEEAYETEEAMEEAQGMEEAMEEALGIEEAMECPQEELEEEPKTVSFVKVDGPEGIEYEHLGIRRQVIDRSGFVRNEIEL
jgi:hypothetical protein